VRIYGEQFQCTALFSCQTTFWMYHWQPSLGEPTRGTLPADGRRITDCQAGTLKSVGAPDVSRVLIAIATEAARCLHALGI
jgi:hypothetical protein